MAKDVVITAILFIAIWLGYSYLWYDATGGTVETDKETHNG